MMRRTSLLLSAAVVVGALFAAGIGSDLASGQTEIHVVTIAAEAKYATVDHRPAGEDPGDRFVVWEPLFGEDGATRTGRAYWDFLVVGKVAGHRRWVGTLWLTLPDGRITLQGVEEPGKVDVYAVTGGTGAYANAQGDATLTRDDGIRDIVIHLAA